MRAIVMDAAQRYIRAAMANQSTLHDLHQRLGAVFAERDGWLLPEHFGDAGGEYDAVVNGAAIYDLAGRAMLQFTGADRLSFLQGMLSNDLLPLKMFDGVAAALLTQQGKVVADLRVLCSLNSFYLDFWAPLQETILSHLNRYLVADEVEVNDPNERWKMLSIQGPHAQAILDRIFAGAVLPVRLHHHGMVQYGGAPVCVVRSDWSGYGGIDVILPSDQLESFVERLRALGAVWVGTQAQEVLRVEAGQPRYGVDFSADNLLLEVDLADSVSFSKGCYLGQEVVERIRSRGHVNRKLCGLLLDGDVPANPGDKLMDGDKETGQITSSVFSRALKQAIALGYVSREFWAPGSKLNLLHTGKAVGATVAPRPLNPSLNSVY